MKHQWIAKGKTKCGEKVHSSNLRKEFKKVTCKACLELVMKEVRDLTRVKA